MGKHNETAWLVERYLNGVLHYLSLACAEASRDGHGYTTQANDALRFAREQDATAALIYLANGEGRVAAHEWMVGE